MKKFWIIALISITLLASNGFAAMSFDLSTNQLMDLLFTSTGEAKPILQQQIQKANTYVHEVPQFIRDIFGNERINVYITDVSGKVINLGAITENTRIKEIKGKLIENPSLNVFGDETTIKGILNSENRIQEFQDALREGKIRYEGIGFLSSIKFGIISFFQSIYLSISSWIG